MKVEQFYNKNQFHIYSDTTYEQENGEQIDILQSYDSTVIKIEKEIGKKPIVTLGCDWNYSTTTSKHVYKFLEEYGYVNFYGITNKRSYIQKLIDNGTIKYDENMR